MGSVWGEYIPNWIAAVGTGLGFLAAGVAAFLTWRALRQDLAKDRSAKAMGLGAWWVASPASDGTRSRWGVLVSNGASAPFYNVKVFAIGNNHRLGGAPIELATVPPGRYFIESRSKSDPYAWKISETATTEQFNPVIHETTEKGISRIEFTDTNGFRWCWAPGEGVVPVRRA